MADHRDDLVPGLATLAVHGGGSASAIEAIERRLAALEGGTAAVAVAAGGNLPLIALAPLMRPADEIVVAREIGSALRAPLKDAEVSFGWAARDAALDDAASFERAISPRTQAILVPSLTPLGALADLTALARLAKRANVPLLVDNTEATPVLLRPLSFGADIVVHGNGALLANEGGIGFIVDGGSFDWSAASGRYPMLTEARGEGGALADTVGNFAYAAACRITATALPSVDAARIGSGLATLPLRIAQQSRSALVLAEHLADHSAVGAIAYPGLPGDRHHVLAATYCPASAGRHIAFALRDHAHQAFIGRLRLIGTDLGAHQPAMTTVAVVGDGNGAPRLVLSVGLEDVADLVADLEGALADGE